MNVLVSRFVLDKLEQFIPVLQRYGQGNLSLRLTAHGADEIGQLAAQFNHMADGLETRARENARLYRELEDKEAARTFLLHKAIVAQEEERKHLARELHDDFAQSLTALSITVESALRTLPNDMTAVHERLGRVQELTQETLAETSRWIQELRPHVLDDLGLAPALRSFAEGRFEGSGTRVQVEACNLPEHLPPDVEITLFRILQEGLSNAARYASASHVYVRVEQFASGMLVAHIEDDGVGFLPGKYLNPHDDLRGMGLLGMRERTALLGGTLTIDSTPGRGTRLRAEIPWTQPTL
jgi:signal transduction histidine kinase